MLDPFARSRWNQTQVVLWVCTLNKDAVKLAGYGFADHVQLLSLAIQKYPSRYGPECKSGGTPLGDSPLERAEDEVIEAACRGDFCATGIENGQGGRKEIPHVQWADFRFYWAPVLYYDPISCARRYYDSPSVGSRELARPDAPHWTDVLFEREAILKLWPDRQAGANGKQVEVNDWFINVYVPEQAGRIPSRPEAEKAARNKFGVGVRASLREAWAEHAPPSWRKRGPKGLNRKIWSA